MRLTNPTMDRDDAPFPSVAPRNWLQESIELPALLTALAVPTGGRLLEVGCGRGVALPIFNRRLYSASITGIDVDQSALADARARAHATGTRVDLRHADVRQLPFPAGAFDIVFDFGTCFHIADPDRALREIARVLRPGGLVSSFDITPGWYGGELDSVIGDENELEDRSRELVARGFSFTDPPSPR